MELDLRYIRRGLPGLLGRSTGRGEEQATLEQLYSERTLASIVQKFQILLDSDPEEPEVQTFLEENPIFWNMFAPDLIVNKAPILAAYKTDFAILSQTSTLYLVEIEKPSKKILKKDGGPTQAFSQPLRQVRDWLHEFSLERSACLRAMKIPEKSVSRVHGVVIIGRDGKYPAEALAKLKGADYGQVTFLTYDDLKSSVASLISSFKKL